MQALYVDLIDRLREQGFKGEIGDSLEEREAHAYDESIFYVRPELVMYPQDVRDIQIAASLVQELSEPTHSLHLSPRAAGSGLSGGSLNDSVVINTTRHFNNIHGHSEQDGKVFFDVDPGVYYRDLEKDMDKLGVYIPSFPASKDLCSLGGMVGNNAAGAHSFRYGHTAEFVESMEVVLADGGVYTLKALERHEFETIISEDSALSTLYQQVWSLVRDNEALINNSRPHTRKNSAGYALWDVLSESVAEFEQGKGTINLVPLFVGSQGSLGVITRLLMRTSAKPSANTLLVVPVFDLDSVGEVINSISKDDPLAIELFDGPSYRAAMDNRDFFKNRIDQSTYRKTIAQLDKIYHRRFGKKIPHFVLLAEYTDQIDQAKSRLDFLHQEIAKEAWIATHSYEQEMLWQVRRASYSLSQLVDPSKRPAAFLEDMIVPPAKLGALFRAIQDLFKSHDIKAFVHGHGGDGHLHFYPLLDFTDPQTAQKIPHMAEEFFHIANQLGGNICGEHNDGIIRTPYLHHVFSKEMITLFEQLEALFDPQDIFNPGKKVNPKFEIARVVRHTNK